MLKSAIKYREIELMKPLDDAGILGVIATEIKRRRDSVEQYRAGNRPDLADKEEAEIAILQDYLPAAALRGRARAKVVEAVIADRRAGAEGHGRGDEGAPARGAGAGRRQGRLGAGEGAPVRQSRRGGGSRAGGARSPAD